MWKYESLDFQNISLHDHIVDRIKVDSYNIYLIFDDGFSIIKTHPLNDTGKSQDTKKSQIILRRCKFLNGTIESDNPQGHKGNIDFSQLISSLQLLEVLGFEVGVDYFTYMATVLLMK